MENSKKQNTVDEGNDDFNSNIREFEQKMEEFDDAYKQIKTKNPSSNKHELIIFGTFKNQEI